VNVTVPQDTPTFQEVFECLGDEGVVANADVAFKEFLLLFFYVNPKSCVEFCGMLLKFVSIEVSEVLVNALSRVVKLSCFPRLWNVAGTAMSVIGRFCKANPAEFALTLRAGDVIASEVLFDTLLTSWALLSVKHHPLEILAIGFRL
jgi:hypothetical protein